MDIKKQRLITTKRGDVSYEFFFHILIPSSDMVYFTGDERLIRVFLKNKSLKIVNAYDDLSEEQKCICKQAFNCMQPVDDALFFNAAGKLLCAVPYGLIELLEIAEEIRDLTTRDNAQSETLRNFILWLATKKLNYIDIIAKTTCISEEAVIYAFRIGMEMTKKSKAEKIASLNTIYECFIHEYEKKESAPFAKTMLRLNNERAEQQKAACGIIENRKTTKNLIVLQLESLSHETMINVSQLMPTLCKLNNRAINFPAFYSSSTSPVLSLYDFFYGNDFDAEYLRNGTNSSTGSEHMFSILQQNGYTVAGMSIDCENTGEVSNLWSIPDQKYVYLRDFNSFLNGIIGFIKHCKAKNEPFALHIRNPLTEPGNCNEETARCSTYSEKSTLSYLSIDAVARTIVSTLHDENLLNDTIISCFSGCGCDMWTREINSGFMHTIPPFKNVIHTPCFIFDHDIKPFIYTSPASMVDLKHTLLYMLGVNSDNESVDTNIPLGVNLFKHKNEFVYSRSLDSLDLQNSVNIPNDHSFQRLNGYNNSRIKNTACAVLSDRYMLLAKENGLSLYMIELDPCGYNDILRFIEFDENSNPVRLDNKSAWHEHFRAVMMRDPQLFDIFRQLNILKTELKKRLAIRKLLGLAVDEFSYIE